MNKMIDAMEYLDSRIIEEADETVKNYSRKKRTNWVVFAASISVLILAATNVAIYIGNSNKPGTNNNQEMFPAPNWDEMETYQKYCEVEINGVKYWGSASSTFERGEYLGSFVARGVESVYVETDDKRQGGNVIESTIVTGYVPEGGVTAKDVLHETPVDAFTIKGIDSDFAVAITFVDYDESYVFCNPEFVKNTWGEYSQAVQFGNYVIANEIYLYDEKTGETLKSIDKVPKDLIMNELLENVDFPVYLSDSKDFMAGTVGYKLADIGIDYTLLAEKNHSLSLYKNGYVSINIGETAKFIYVDKEHVNHFLEMINTKIHNFQKGEGSNDIGIKE